MKFVKTEGVVLREIDTGDADKIVILLTPEHGRITISAVGAKRPRSKFVGCTEFLCYSKFDLFKGKDNYRLNECRILEPFYEIRSDMLKFAYASYFSEILNDIVMEEHPAKRELKLFLNCLHFIANGKKDRELVAAVFELRILSICGMSPYMDSCLKCGGKDFAEHFFSFRQGGIICKACLGIDNSAMKILEGTYQAITYILKQPISKAFSFELAEEVRDQVRHISKKFILDRLEKKYKSMEFIEKMKM